LPSLLRCGVTGGATPSFATKIRSRRSRPDGQARRPRVCAPHQLGRPLVLTDGVTNRALRRTGLYAEMMRPLGVRNVLKVFLPPHPHGGSALVFDTSARFHNEDRVVIQRLAPALIQLERNSRARSLPVAAHPRLSRLTPRELEVLARASGEASAQIAAALLVSENTVRKHLQRIYEKLEVPNRAAATAIYARSYTAAPRN
jgi:DNA-binding CsgD family transcriptional regulator